MFTLLCLILKVIDFMINLFWGRSAEHETRFWVENFIEKAFEVIKDWKVSCHHCFDSRVFCGRPASFLFFFYVNAIRRWGISFLSISDGAGFAVNDNSESSCAIKREGNRAGTGSFKNVQQSYRNENLCETRRNCHSSARRQTTCLHVIICANEFWSHRQVVSLWHACEPAAEGRVGFTPLIETV